MFHRFIDALVAFGPAGLLILAFVDSLGVPVATGMDALLVLIAVKTPAQAPWAALLAVLGSCGGNAVLFSLARRGGRRYLVRSGRPERVARFRAWFERYGLVTVFVPALMPIPMPLKLFVISAGALEMRMRSFLLVVAAARVMRFGADAWLGVTLGQQSARWMKSHTAHFAVAAVLLAICLYLLIRLNDRWRARLHRVPQ